MSLQLRNCFLLFITASIWGSGFVAQSLGMNHVSPFTFTWARSLIGGCFLLVVIPFLDAWQKPRIQQAHSETKTTPSPWKDRLVWIGGFWCGTLLFVSESLQQFGLLYTTVGKAAFLTSLYIVFVPIVGTLVGRVTNLLVWIAVGVAVTGLYFLCMPQGEFTLTLGDSLVLACAFSFTFHILVIDHYAPHVDCVRMSCIQFFVGSLWGLVLMLAFEPPTWAALQAALPAILYAGIMSNGIAYTLQIVGQTGVPPTLASLIMSLESVVGVICGWLILSQAMTMREIGGCALMFAAIVLAQLPARKVLDAVARLIGQR